MPIEPEKDLRKEIADLQDRLTKVEAAAFITRIRIPDYPFSMYSYEIPTYKISVADAVEAMAKGLGYKFENKEAVEAAPRRLEIVKEAPPMTNDNKPSKPKRTKP